MKVLLSLVIPAWIGWAGGALTEGVVPRFWAVWGIFGLLLMVVTAAYIYYERRPV